MRIYLHFLCIPLEFVVNFVLGESIYSNIYKTSDAEPDNTGVYRETTATSLLGCVQYCLPDHSQCVAMDLCTADGVMLCRLRDTISSCSQQGDSANCKYYRRVRHIIIVYSKLLQMIILYITCSVCPPISE
jgi:hypothetical protein